MKKKIAVICSGQGSQYVGQTKTLESLSYYEKANEVLGVDLLKISDQGPVEELNMTENTQPSLLIHSLSLHEQYLKPLNQNFQVEYILGHSVGEYAALVLAESLDFETALKAVKLRGQSMQKAIPLGIGSMFAVLKLSSAEVAQACEQASDEKFQVSVANDNSPGQLVISGHKEACSKAIEILNQAHGKVRAIELKVSAPFHSQLMMPAEEKMKDFFKDAQVKENTIAYIPNISAKVAQTGTSAETIKKNLVDQICGQVQWTKSIEEITEHVDAFVELGPGKTLKGLIKRISPEKPSFSMDLESDRSLFSQWLKD